jgi:hypothetical protein
MAAFGTLGTRLYIGDTPLANIEAAADAIADFTSLTTAAEIGLIENMGEFGKVFDLVTFQAIATGRMYKFKGGYNQGALDLVMASDVTDVGQALLYAYGNAQDQNTYPMKMVLNGADPAFDTVYFGVKIFSYRIVAGSVNNVMKANCKMEINTDVYIGAT